MNGNRGLLELDELALGEAKTKSNRSIFGDEESGVRKDYPDRG